jgi:toxin CcdB
MPQFDVHRNSGRQRAAIPFVVVLQSRRFDGAATRLVAPLVAADALQPGREASLYPTFDIEGRRVMLDPLAIQTLPASALGPAIASLADDASANAIIKAIDLVLSRAWG